MASVSEELDGIKAELERKFPGWRIWYTRHHIGAPGWSAWPQPALTADSPEGLAAKINAAHEAVSEYPALATRAEYAVVAAGVTQAAGSTGGGLGVVAY